MTKALKDLWSYRHRREFRDNRTSRRHTLHLLCMLHARVISIRETGDISEVLSNRPGSEAQGHALTRVVAFEAFETDIISVLGRLVDHPTSNSRRSVHSIHVCFISFVFVVCVVSVVFCRMHVVRIWGEQYFSRWLTNSAYSSTSTPFECFFFALYARGPRTWKMIDFSLIFYVPCWAMPRLKRRRRKWRANDVSIGGESTRNRNRNRNSINTIIL